MENHSNNNAGSELLFLLRQQRYLYHQLKILAEKQHQLAGTNSPESLLEILSGRRKLIEKLEELNGKLRPIRTNWRKVSSQIGPEYTSEAHKIANQVQKIIGQILAISPSETAGNLPLGQDWEFDELFAET